MKAEQITDLDSEMYSFLDSRINTHIEQLELKFKEYTSDEVNAAVERLIERGLIYVVKYIHEKPLYATVSKRHLQTPYP